MSPFPLERVPQSTKYCKLMMNQLIFLQSFIEDLLDLRQLRDGVFSLVLEPLDVSETLKEICSIFDPQLQKILNSYCS